MDEIAAYILGHKDDKRVPKLKKSIQYYLDGAKDNNAIKNKTKSQEKIINNKGKTDTLELAAGIIDVNKLESESINSQVIFNFKTNLFIIFLKTNISEI